ncbi:hypothetical protein Trad_1159 [Truepera radiovictrix DSM 17093]|uniref:Uncharacterized protein n=1 Tax=Truepera radiovictrix (strain DSM 17093 / CIP 108686 / LMG 22925 / RQ-24) TaxID=649638 RepID=D7CW21_TRURR|nr:hypothetical protein Trad_1159 [Truepera radiovictrix DSM 17093]
MKGRAGSLWLRLLLLVAAALAVELAAFATTQGLQRLG